MLKQKMGNLNSVWQTGVSQASLHIRITWDHLKEKLIQLVWGGVMHQQVLKASRWFLSAPRRPQRAAVPHKQIRVSKRVLKKVNLVVMYRRDQSMEDGRDGSTERPFQVCRHVEIKKQKPYTKGMAQNSFETRRLTSALLTLLLWPIVCHSKSHLTFL